MSEVRSLGREEITVSTTEVALPVHRTDGTPPLFAGFRLSWANGEIDHPDGEISYAMEAGAGAGSSYLTYSITLPDGTTVHEYVNMIDFFRGRISAILTEHGLDA